ncbi:MAG: putative LPS assembly protein LptD [Bacteroidota bacterium]
MSIRTGYSFLFWCLFFCIQVPLHAQQRDSVVTTSPDSLVSAPDSTLAMPDSVARGATTSEEPARKSQVKDAVEFQSSDSLIIDFRKGRKAFLVGSSKVSHTAGELTAGKISMDLETSTMQAKSENPQDTLSHPVLKQQDQEIKSTRILFNYKTQKGKFEEAIVNVSEGVLIGSKVKNMSEREVFIENAKYSTCPPEYLYYYLLADRMKVVDQDEIFFTNARLFLLDIPYPLVFPFGYFPLNVDRRQSGILTPTYVFQEQSARGVGLQNIGWFQYFSDYFTGQFSADVFTSGTIFTNSILQYRKTDAFNGTVNVGYSVDRGLEPTDPDFRRTVQRSLAINHSQTFSPYSSITANVSLRTSDFFTQNSFDINRRAETSSNSRLSYNYRQPDNKYSFGVSAASSQNFANNTTSIQGPNATFSLTQLTPFQRPGSSSSNQRWYETMSINYNNAFSSDFNYRPIDADSAEVSFFDALFNPSDYREATGNNDYIRAGLRQTATLRFGQLIPSQFLTVSANITGNEYWYPSSIRRSFNADSNRVEEEKILGFNAARDYNASLSFSTTFYGTSQAKLGRFEGFRHTVIPTLSFAYRPDFSSSRFGYYREVQTDTSGSTQTYSIYEGQLIPGPGSGEQRALNFGIRNVFETKVVRRDSTGEVNTTKLRLIDDLSARASYNFAGEQFRLSNLNTSISSNAIDRINLRATANFDFYQTVANENGTGTRINSLWLANSSRIAQLQTFTFNASTAFRGGSRGVQVFTPVYRQQYDPFNQGIFGPIDPHFGLQPVAPAGSPWSFALRFNYTWRWQFQQSPVRSAIMNADGITFNLTPKWRFATTLGYDFIERDLTPSQFNLSRDLECWSLAFQINPFGEFQYYFFSLSLNSAQIQGLFQKLPLLRNLERNSSPQGRGLGQGF